MNLAGPIWPAISAALNNPLLGGEAGRISGYHKPIMIAGGMGNIRPMLVKNTLFQPVH